MFVYMNYFNIQLLLLGSKNWTMIIVQDCSGVIFKLVQFKNSWGGWGFWFLFLAAQNCFKT